MNKDILVCGVGGQGTVLASKLIASAAMNCGNMVHSAETIGMAQRGGSVTSHIRIGKEAYADIILAFEPAEAVRNLAYLKKGGIVIANCVPVKPVTESLQDTGYDGRQMVEYLKEKVDCLIIDAEEICRPFHSSRYFNAVILGAAAGSGRLGLAAEALLDAIGAGVREEYVTTNKQAFMAGLEAGKKYAAE